MERGAAQPERPRRAWARRTRPPCSTPRRRAERYDGARQNYGRRRAAEKKERPRAPRLERSVFAGATDEGRAMNEMELELYDSGARGMVSATCTPRRLGTPSSRGARGPSSGQSGE